MKKAIQRQRRPRHPGDILMHLFLEPRGITITRFAEATGLTRKHVSYVVHGRADISAESAVRFAMVLGTTPQFWINLQTAVQVWDAQQKLHNSVEVQKGAFAFPAVAA